MLDGHAVQIVQAIDRVADELARFNDNVETIIKMIKEDIEREHE